MRFTYEPTDHPDLAQAEAQQQTARQLERIADALLEAVDGDGDALPAVAGASDQEVREAIDALSEGSA